MKRRNIWQLAGFLLLVGMVVSAGAVEIKEGERTFKYDKNVELKDVKNMPDLAALQSDLEKYILATTGMTKLAVTPKFPKLTAKEVRVLGNPVVQKNKSVLCQVLNAKEEPKTYSFENVDTALDFFIGCAATCPGSEILINAHMGDAADLVHELVHCYHGSDARWDQYFNEGLTDYFTIDFVKSADGKKYAYTPAKGYVEAVSIIEKLIAQLGKKNIASFFFQTIDPDITFKNFAKKTAMILFERQKAVSNPTLYVFKCDPSYRTKDQALWALNLGKVPPELPKTEEINKAGEALKKAMKW